VIELDMGGTQLNGNTMEEGREKVDGYISTMEVLLLLVQRSHGFVTRCRCSEKNK